MSGGVDSSVTAALIQQRGFECIGATMNLFCGLAKDANDAQKVAHALGMRHFVFDLIPEFEKNVISRFVCQYEKGLTPNPCIDCNRNLKFGALLEKADSLGCDVIATGHYARVVFENGRYLLKKGVDESKDQSYVLYSLTQAQLSKILFPLGELDKTAVRSIAQSFGFENSHKKDSQDICFVPDGDYAAFIEDHTGKKYPEGNFTDTDGNILGTHRGIIRYTIGQRKGLGLALPQPMYVKEKNIDTNTVVLCKNEELFYNVLIAKEFNWITFEDPPERFEAYVKTRYKAKPAKATVTPITKDRVRIVFEQPQRAITAGQAAVLYDGDTVIGGGTIE